MTSIETKKSLVSFLIWKYYFVDGRIYRTVSVNDHRNWFISFDKQRNSGSTHVYLIFAYKFVWVYFNYKNVTDHEDFIVFELWY